jgi:L-proline amide hydrolase
LRDHEGRLEWRGHETWYRVVGDLDSAAAQAPVVICHGGPGAAHDYCEPIADLSRFGRACILYDQLGCGRSELLPDAPARMSSSTARWPSAPLEKWRER